MHRKFTLSCEQTIIKNAIRQKKREEEKRQSFFAVIRAGIKQVLLNLKHM